MQSADLQKPCIHVAGEQRSTNVQSSTQLLCWLPYIPIRLVGLDLYEQLTHGGEVIATSTGSLPAEMKGY